MEEDAIVAITYRSLWLSDIHLGTRACRAGELLKFLDEVEADRIYLVGDIIDLERMKVRSWFPDTHMRVIAEFARRAGNGSSVTFVPGNHDVEFRSLAGQEILGIPIELEACHRTPDGRRLLVTHGDLLDGRIRQGTNLEKFGAAAYDLLTDAEVVINQWRQSLGRDFVRVAASIKHRIKSAREYISRFETIAAQYATERGFDGIVCGHIHKPNVRTIDGCLYANDGDWVEHSTALAETLDGELKILGWQTDEQPAGKIGDTDLLAA